MAMWQMISNTCKNYVYRLGGYTILKNSVCIQNFPLFLCYTNNFKWVYCCTFYFNVEIFLPTKKVLHWDKYIFFTFIVISAIIAQIKRLIGLPYAKLVKRLKWLCLSRSKKEEESALNYISIKQANRKTKKVEISHVQKTTKRVVKASL